MSTGPEGARVANRADADAVGVLVKDYLARLAKARGGPALAGKLEALLSSQSLADLLSESFAPAIVVGTYEAVVAGFALVSHEPERHTACVEALYVEEELRRVGVGEAILAAVEELARSWQATAVDVVTLPGDAATKSLLEVAGMRTRLLVMTRAL